MAYSFALVPPLALWRGYSGSPAAALITGAIAGLTLAPAAGGGVLFAPFGLGAVGLEILGYVGSALVRATAASASFAAIVAIVVKLSDMIHSNY